MSTMVNCYSLYLGEAKMEDKITKAKATAAKEVTTAVKVPPETDKNLETEKRSTPLSFPSFTSVPHLPNQ